MLPLVAIPLADLCRLRPHRRKPSLSERQTEMRQRVCSQPRPLVTRHPKAQPTPRGTAEKKGYRDGLNDQHYFPKLDFSSGSEWVAWFRGWKRGHAEFRRRRGW